MLLLSGFIMLQHADLQYTSTWVPINLFNIGDNVPGQMKESSLTFLVIGSEVGRNSKIHFVQIYEGRAREAQGKCMAGPRSDPRSQRPPFHPNEKTLS